MSIAWVLIRPQLCGVDWHITVVSSWISNKQKHNYALPPKAFFPGLCPVLPVPQYKQGVFQILLGICSFLVQIQSQSMGLMFAFKFLWDLESNYLGGFYFQNHHQNRWDQLKHLNCQHLVFWDLKTERSQFCLQYVSSGRIWSLSEHDATDFFVWLGYTVHVILVWCSGFFCTAGVLHIPYFHVAQQILLKLSSFWLNWKLYLKSLNLMESNWSNLPFHWDSHKLHNIISILLTYNLKSPCTLLLNLAFYTFIKYYIRQVILSILYVIKSICKILTLYTA